MDIRVGAAARFGLCAVLSLTAVACGGPGAGRPGGTAGAPIAPSASHAAPVTAAGGQPAGASGPVPSPGATAAGAGPRAAASGPATTSPPPVAAPPPPGARSAGSTPAGPGPLCPTGRPSVEVTYVNALAQAGVGGDLTVWLVVVRGTVTNKSNAPIRVKEVDVRLEGGLDVEVTTASVRDGELAPGKTTKWATTSLAQGAAKPTPAASIDGRWQWTHVHAGCPSG